MWHSWCQFQTWSREVPPFLQFPAPYWISNRAHTIARLPVTRFWWHREVLVGFSSVLLVCRAFGGMKASSSVEETSSAPWKRRGKYCAAFDCDNSAYDVKGTRTSYHFFEFPRTLSEGIGRCLLIKRRHGQDDFVVSTATVLYHEHFRAEEISKKLSCWWNLRTGLW